MPHAANRPAGLHPRAIGLLMTLALLLSATACDAGTPPNLLFILTEDQGAHAEYLGTPGLQTPNIDALARSGVAFGNAFVGYPVCSASKAVLYTGLHSHTNGILNNTHNYHKPASRVTDAERNRELARSNRIREPYATLTEILAAGGYYQGVTHKLHVLPNEKFPYDQFLHGTRDQLSSFFEQASRQGRPWFLMVNIPYSHRPYPNSDKHPIRVRPDQIRLPEFLPDSPEVRKDWCEYLAGIEKVDAATGEALSALRESGEYDDTVIIFMSDHGPTYPHGKMTLYDLGLRVPLIISGPGIRSGIRSDELVSEVDLLPTIMEVCGIEQSFPYRLHGNSIVWELTGTDTGIKRQHVFAEISNRGPLPNDGMQERCVFDGRWKLIYREKVETAWRQVNADSRQFKTWGNRVYAETIRLKDRSPQAYRILAEMDPQSLGGSVPAVELYDLESDPDEMQNLAEIQQFNGQRERLLDALKRWAIETSDPAVFNTGNDQ